MIELINSRKAGSPHRLASGSAEQYRFSYAMCIFEKLCFSKNFARQHNQFFYCIGMQIPIQKKDLSFPTSLFFYPGSFLLSRAVTSQVSSALQSLTSVFGMGTGVSSVLSPPSYLIQYLQYISLCLLIKLFHSFLGQALDLLVPVS